MLRQVFPLVEPVGVKRVQRGGAGAGVRTVGAHDPVGAAVGGPRLDLPAAVRQDQAERNPARLAARLVRHQQPRALQPVRVHDSVLVVLRRVGAEQRQDQEGGEQASLHGTAPTGDAATYFFTRR